MHFTVTTWRQMQQHWDGVINFLMAGEVANFDFALPAIEDVVDQLRFAERSRILSGIKSATFDFTDIKQEFLALPIDEAMRRPFNMGNFRLDDLLPAGKLFHGLYEKWVEPWQEALQEHGFTFRECFPIAFVSGVGCATNYHLDASQVMAWQRYGTKYFNGLRDPDRWSTPEQRFACSLNQTRPAEIGEAETLAYTMPPGSVLWNAFATPHWVDAGDEVAMTMSMVHRGLRLHGKLCPHELANEQLAASRSAEAPPAAGYGQDA